MVSIWWRLACSEIECLVPYGPKNLIEDPFTLFGEVWELAANFS